MHTLDALDDEFRALGERLKVARARRRWSQLDLATRMGTSRQTVENMEMGKPIRLSTLGLALRALGLSLEPLRAIADPAADAVGLSAELARTRHKKITVSELEKQEFGG